MSAGWWADGQSIAIEPHLRLEEQAVSRAQL